MIIKTLTCALCGKEFQRTAYPSRFKLYKDTYCSKRCALIGCREKYRPTQGIITRSDGRRMIRIYNHPNANKNNQIPYAHYIIEKQLNRYLDKDEIVHHKDGNPANDDINNLQLMSLSEHIKLHNKLKARDNHGRFKAMPKMRESDETKRQICLI